MQLKAPFPYFGGKSTVAKTVWERLGPVDNYIEPFCGSAAMLLLRSSEPKVETLNDINAYIANFWRAVQGDPEAVAFHADWPVNETDMHARHKWLVRSEEATQVLKRVKDDPEHFNAKIAGWWCWGACCWIGSGWCAEGVDWAQLPEMNSERGVRGELHQKRPRAPRDTSNGKGWMPGVAGRPVQKRPNITGWSDKGVNSGGRVQLADAYARGRGVNGNDSASTIEQRQAWITDWMVNLADRLRAVRVCCGHWSRPCDSQSTLTRLGLTGVFLDPPYRKSIKGKKNRAENLYASDKGQDTNGLCDEVQAWCLKWCDDPQIRIALCGYEGEYDLPGWTVEEWKSGGGYGNQSGEVNENASRERIWFSPACIKPIRTKQLF